MVEPTASGRRLAVSICGPYGCRASVLHGVFRESRPLVLGHVFNLAHYTLHPPRYNLVDGPHSILQIIMFSDLECDYINPIDLCNKLNQVSSPLLGVFRVLTPLQFVLPENSAHAFLTLLFLLFGQWIAFLLNAPLVAFNANKYVLSKRLVHVLIVVL
jgi:hypothetical protein